MRVAAVVVMALVSLCGARSGAVTLTNVLTESSGGVYRCDLIRACKYVHRATKARYPDNQNMCGFTTNGETKCSGDYALNTVAPTNTRKPAPAYTGSTAACKAYAQISNDATNTDEFLYVHVDILASLECVHLSSATTRAPSRVVIAAATGAAVVVVGLLAR